MNFEINKAKQSRGFLLVDATLGIFVVVIGLAALAALYTYGIGIMGSSDKEEKAVQIAAEQIEIIKADSEQSASVFNTWLADNIGTEAKPHSKKIDDIEYKFWAIGSPEKETITTDDNKLYYVQVFVEWSEPQKQTMDLQTYIILKD